MALLPDQIKQVLRRLGRAPLFTVVTLLTLAVGIGANTVIFSVVEGVLLKPLSYAHADQLVGVWYHIPGIEIENMPMAPFLYFIEREQGTTFEDIGAYQGDSLSVTGTGEPEHVSGLDVTDGTLPILGVQPAVGRLFTRRDDSPGSRKLLCSPTDTGARSSEATNQSLAIRSSWTARSAKSSVCCQRIFISLTEKTRLSTSPCNGTATRQNWGTSVFRVLPASSRESRWHRSKRI